MDGNYSNTYDVRMPRARTLIWLDYARSVCLRRMLPRTLVGYARVRPDLPESCQERFDIPFFAMFGIFRKNTGRGSSTPSNASALICISLGCAATATRTSF
jgi:adenylate kinase family enzyme